MKYYAVKRGRKSGIYFNWEDCKEQVNGYPSAEYKSFKTVEDANAYILNIKDKTVKYDINSINCDGAYSSATGKMEFNIRDTKTGNILYEKSYSCGTNNLAEFLALVQALKLSKGKIIYTDSKTAISWVNNRWVNSSFNYTVDKELHTDINEALLFLEGYEKHKYNIKKWDTKSWGQIPSDYGRK